MRPLFYRLDAEGQPVPTTSDDPELLALWANNPDREHHPRRVAVSNVDAWEVSTVFLAFDHGLGDGPPVLWETMVFGPEPWDQWQTRYVTRSAALAGHQQVVDALLRGDGPPE